MIGPASRFVGCWALEKSNIPSWASLPNGSQFHSIATCGQHTRAAPAARGLLAGAPRYQNFRGLFSLTSAKLTVHAACLAIWKVVIRIPYGDWRTGRLATLVTPSLPATEIQQLMPLVCAQVSTTTKQDGLEFGSWSDSRRTNAHERSSVTNIIMIRRQHEERQSG